MTQLYLLIAGVCAIFGALIFQSKNRPPWLGALLGGIFGLVGLVIAAVLSKLPADA